jgi:Arc/MetJ-type ribon-helix-helix transcriptional regulator
MKKVTVAMTDEMVRDLEKERKERRLASVAEVARVIIGDYLASKTAHGSGEDALRKRIEK